MLVPGLIIASEALLSEIEIERPIEQVRNVAYLPGIIGYSIAMPDIHWGYGFPIGGIAAMDVDCGVISPGGVGYDINCGVRLATTSLKYNEIAHSTLIEILKEIFRTVPSGVGHGHRHIDLKEKDYSELLTRGSPWAISNGYGIPEDIDHTESNGCIAHADPSAVSHVAKERGSNQLGSIGSGNHFIEIGEVKKIFSQDVANSWGLKEGLLYILIHSGSRGLGHQVCQDTLNIFVKKGFAKNLPDKQLVAAPIKSEEGKRYFAAMAAAANFAFNNRQYILHAVRLAFKKVCNINAPEIKLLYDVCHNIAKFEHHEFEGKRRLFCVHRKGATRSFGPGHPELPEIFRKSGQPVLVPGDMGRASYVLAGLGNPITWCSSCHGAGRMCSRAKSMEMWRGRSTLEFMKKSGVDVLSSSQRTVAEEMPNAYKDVDSVVLAVEEAGLGLRVAKLTPKLVIKG